MGPVLVTADELLDPQALPLGCRVNGEDRQRSSTKHMVFGVAELVAYLSQVMTLEPGDILFTGTPSGVGKLEDGNNVVVEIEGLGTLKNLVKAEKR